MRGMLSPLIAFVSSLGMCPCAWILFPGTVMAPVPHLPIVVPIPPAGPAVGWAP